MCEFLKVPKSDLYRLKTRHTQKPPEMQENSMNMGNSCVSILASVGKLKNGNTDCERISLAENEIIIMRRSSVYMLLYYVDDYSSECKPTSGMASMID